MAEIQPGAMTDHSQFLTDNTTNDRTQRQKRGGRRSRKDGVELLRQAADRCLVLNSEELAHKLSDKALKGDLACAKALVDLAGGKTPPAKRVRKRREPSLADQLAAERPWEGPEEEE